MMRYTIPNKKSIAVAAAFGTAILMIPLASTSPIAHAATHPLAAPAISIRSVYATTKANRSAKTFKNGERVVYHIIAKNSSSRTLKVTVSYFTWTIKSHGNAFAEYIIANKSYKKKMRPGVSKFHVSSTIPQGSTPGSYTLDGMVFENSHRADNASVSSKPFHVKHIAHYPLKVPYFSQFDESNSNNECGETAVAMAAAYYVDLYDTHKEWIAAVRNQLGISRKAETNAKQLTAALWGLQEMQITVTRVPGKTPISRAVNEIKRATKAGHPVIAFINARKLHPPRPYSGHWIVIVGISGKYVYVNDPDNIKKQHGTGKMGTIKWSLAEYKAAAKSGVTSQKQPYALIVKGEDFKSG